jgi:UDP-arabinose 4-epimerase
VVNVLVTGGAGYVGSHVCKLLASRNIRPVTFDSLENGHKELVRWGPLITGDIRDKAAIRHAIDHHRIEAAFHFLARASVAESVMRSQSMLGREALTLIKRIATVFSITFWIE